MFKYTLIKPLIDSSKCYVFTKEILTIIGENYVSAINYIISKG